MGEATADNATTLRVRLEHGEAKAADAVPLLASAALEAATRTTRLDACRLLGDLAGRALGAEWDVAERAAFACSRPPGSPTPPPIAVASSPRWAAGSATSG